MPASSEKQRRAFAVAMTNPDALFAKNKAMADMSLMTLKDFATKLKKRKRNA